MEAIVHEKDDEYMTTDEVAALLVKLFADYKCANGNWANEEKYAQAVGIAIRMLTD